jgi:hypothetical protein
LHQASGRQGEGGEEEAGLERHGGLNLGFAEVGLCCPLSGEARFWSGLIIRQTTFFDFSYAPIA